MIPAVHTQPAAPAAKTADAAAADSPRADAGFDAALDAVSSDADGAEAVKKPQPKTKGTAPGAAVVDPRTLADWWLMRPGDLTVAVGEDATATSTGSTPKATDETATAAETEAGDDQSVDLSAVAAIVVPVDVAMPKAAIVLVAGEGASSSAPGANEGQAVVVGPLGQEAAVVDAAGVASAQTPVVDQESPDAASSAVDDGKANAVPVAAAADALAAAAAKAQKALKTAIAAETQQPAATTQTIPAPAAAETAAAKGSEDAPATALPSAAVAAALARALGQRSIDGQQTGDRFKVEAQSEMPLVAGAAATVQATALAEGRFGSSTGNGGSAGGQEFTEAAPATSSASQQAAAWTTAQASDFTARLITATGHVAEVSAGSLSGPHEAENLGRMVQSMRMQVTQGVSEATMRLNPDYLGDVNISIKVDGNVVTATVHAESSSVRQWLQANEEVLRSGLAEQGLHLDHFVVEQGKPDERSPQQDDAQQQQPDQRRWRYRRPRADQDEARFEVSA